MENLNEHDMTKRMLDRIRTGNHQSNSINENIQTNGYVKPQRGVIDEHDMTKQMLNIIRENNVEMETTFEEGSNDVIKVEDDELGDEATKLRDMVGGVDLKLYEVYPKDKNVVMVGVLDNGIEFKFSKKEAVPYINMENMRLDTETVEVIKKLQGYYVNWAQYWAEKISEYTRSV